MHVHAFSPLEVFQGAQTNGDTVPQFLRKLKSGGLGSLPGTAAEILDDEVCHQDMHISPPFHTNSDTRRKTNSMTLIENEGIHRVQRTEALKSWN